MPNAISLQQLERCLLELGSPVVRVRRHVQELADHHEDLKCAAMEEGLTEADAGARADELLGEPAGLAQHLAAALRQSSWWGRHPVIGFCLLPPLFFLPVACLCFLALCGIFLLSNLLPGAHVSVHDMGVALNTQPANFQSLFVAVNNTVNCLTTGAAAVVFCWLARWSASGWRWALATCAVCSATGLFAFFALAPHSVNLAYGYSRNWTGAVVPLLVAAAMLLRRRITLRRLPALTPTCAKRRELPPKNRLVTPTSVVAAVLIAAVAFGAYWMRAGSARERAFKQARQEELRAGVWPAERAAIEKRVLSRQLAQDTVGEKMIDLSAFTDTGLAESIAAPAEVKDNSLVELPSGVHLYGGVPFDVHGAVQLLGRGLVDGGPLLPTKARNIPIGRKCARLHLLHGASLCDTKDKAGAGLKIAKLLLHYTDGSQQEVGVVFGRDVLDWQGPLHSSDPGKDTVQPSSAATELAWIGSNPRLRSSHSDLSLRLYRSTFANPRPEVEIDRVDYVSTLTPAVPFLVGLTVE